MHINKFESTFCEYFFSQKWLANFSIVYNATQIQHLANSGYDLSLQWEYDDGHALKPTLSQIRLAHLTSSARSSLIRSAMEYASINILTKLSITLLVKKQSHDCNPSLVEIFSGTQILDYVQGQKVRSTYRLFYFEIKENMDNISLSRLTQFIRRSKVCLLAILLK